MPEEDEAMPVPRVRKRSLSGNAAPTSRGTPNEGRSPRVAFASLLSERPRFRSEEDVHDYEEKNASEKSRKSSGSSSSSSSMRNSVPAGSPSDHRSVQSRFRHFFDNFGRPRGKSESSSQSSNNSAAMSSPNNGGTQFTNGNTGCRRPPCSLAPLAICTTETTSSGGPCSPLGSPFLEPIPQGQELATTPTNLSGGSSSASNQSPYSHFHYSASPDLAGGHSRSSSVKKLSRSPKTGIMDRLRSFSVSSPTSPTSPRIPDPSKLPREQPTSSIMFSSQSLKSARFRKLSQPCCSSNDVMPDQFRTVGQCSAMSRSEELLVARLNASSGRNQLERALSPMPDPSTDAGTAHVAITCGVRRVAENKRFLMFSKSPRRTSDDFLEAGTQALGVNNAFSLLFQCSSCYDLMPESAKLIVLDSNLPVGTAFRALRSNAIRGAPVWDSIKQYLVGMVTPTDFIRFVDYHSSNNMSPEDLEAITIKKWIEAPHSFSRRMQWLTPEASLFDALSLFLQTGLHRLPVVDLRSGNVLQLVTPRKLLRYLHLRASELPKPAFLNQSLTECSLGGRLRRRSGVVSIQADTTVGVAIRILLEREVSSVPVVDLNGERLVDVFCKVDAMNLAASGDYSLTHTVEKAIAHRKQTFPAYATCLLSDSLGSIIEKMFSLKVHRLIVINNEEQRRVASVVSILDVLDFMILKYADETPLMQSYSNRTALPRSHSMDQSGSSTSSRHRSSRLASSSSVDGWAPIPLELDEELFKMDVT